MRPISEMDRSVRDLLRYTDGLISYEAFYPPCPLITTIPFIHKWYQEQSILGLLLPFLFSLQAHIARLVPCPNSEIAACYHPSDLLRTVAQAVGTLLENSTKTVGEKQES